MPFHRQINQQDKHARTRHHCNGRKKVLETNLPIRKELVKTLRKTLRLDLDHRQSALREAKTNGKTLVYLLIKKKSFRKLFTQVF